MSISPTDVWASSDYAPTALRLRPASPVVADEVRRLSPDAQHVLDIGAGHGDTAEALLDRGFTVTALEPVARMRETGEQRVPQATWRDACGEQTGLEEHSVDAIASAFGSMLCHLTDGPAEWARVLRPGGCLVMTAWSGEGFLADMTTRMMQALNPGSGHEPPHMQWAHDGVAAQRLGADFEEVTVTCRTLPWNFASVQEGMDLYLHGSPTHAWSLATAGERSDDLLAALRGHLEDCAGPDGSIRAEAGYAVITARRRA